MPDSWEFTTSNHRAVRRWRRTPNKSEPASIRKVPDGSGTAAASPDVTISAQAAGSSAAKLTITQPNSEQVKRFISTASVVNGCEWKGNSASVNRLNANPNTRRSLHPQTAEWLNSPKLYLVFTKQTRYGSIQRSPRGPTLNHDWAVTCKRIRFLSSPRLLVRTLVPCESSLI